MQKVLLTIVNSILLAISFASTSVASDEKRMYFKDWLAACRVETGYCSAIAYVNPNPGNGADADYWLRAGRQKDGEFWEISFTTIKTQPGLTEYFYIEIGEESFSFTRGETARAYGAINDFFLTGDEANKLLTSMLAGNMVEFSFDNQEGAPQNAAFSLSGLTASMLWIDEQQDRLGAPRTVGHSPAGLKIAEPQLPMPSAIPDKLLALHNANHNCDALADLVHGDEWEVHQVANDRLLHIVPCDSGAYNFTYAFYYYETAYDEYHRIMFADYWDSIGWTGTDILVNAYYDPKERTLSSYYKGRGLGDCGTSGFWRWNGYTFKLEEFRAKSECNGWEEGEEVGEFPVIFSSTNK